MPEEQRRLPPGFYAYEGELRAALLKAADMVEEWRAEGEGVVEKLVNHLHQYFDGRGVKLSEIAPWLKEMLADPWFNVVEKLTEEERKEFRDALIRQFGVGDDDVKIALRETRYCKGSCTEALGTFAKIQEVKRPHGGNLEEATPDPEVIGGLTLCRGRGGWEVAELLC